MGISDRICLIVKIALEGVVVSTMHLQLRDRPSSQHLGDRPLIALTRVIAPLLELLILALSKLYPILTLSLEQN